MCVAVVYFVQRYKHLTTGTKHVKGYILLLYHLKVNKTISHNT